MDRACFVVLKALELDVPAVEVPWGHAERSRFQLESQGVLVTSIEEDVGVMPESP